jgi:PAS domain-containing protein
MSDEILLDVLQASNTVVLERLARGVFRIVGRIPGWFFPFCGAEFPDRFSIGPGAGLSFVEHFLEDAEALWETRRRGELRSGPWSETTPDGRTGRVEAVAYNLEGGRVLTLTKLGPGLRERRALLQRARENKLAFERLERAQRSLQRSEEQNRALIAQLETQRANLTAVLNQLRVCTVLLDAEGLVVFANRSCQRLISLPGDDLSGRHWTSALPFHETTKAGVEAMLTLPSSARSRIYTELGLADSRRCWVEIDVQDDPLNSDRHVLYFYGISEDQDLRRVIE